jgi:hypothetical protein
MLTRPFQQQRDYLERCEDRKSYNYLVSLTQPSYLFLSSYFSLGMNKHSTLCITFYIFMYLLKRLSRPRRTLLTHEVFFELYCI